MVLTDFNLLISTSRGNENNACAEIWFLLGEIGDREAIVEKTNVSGLIVAKTVLDPFKVIDDLRRILKEHPDEFRYTLRVVPIEVVVRTKQEEISRAAAEKSSKILENESFRITVEKRHTELSSRKIIEAIAENINRKVDLENPDKIVLIEILGGLTGISIVKPKDILFIVREKIGWLTLRNRKSRVFN
ncbi:MAG: THUMP domain-containing protein [Candidatus Bathyarchaeia archaeon]